MSIPFWSKFVATRPSQQHTHLAWSTPSAGPTAPGQHMVVVVGNFGASTNSQKFLWNLPEKTIDSVESPRWVHLEKFMEVLPYFARSMSLWFEGALVWPWCLYSGRILLRYMPFRKDNKICQLDWTGDNSLGFGEHNGRNGHVGRHSKMQRHPKIIKKCAALLPGQFRRRIPRHVADLPVVLFLVLSCIISSHFF